VHRGERRGDERAGRESTMSSIEVDDRCHLPAARGAQASLIRAAEAEA
jgi:hypothetical protein